MELAGLSADDLDMVDVYSCFPSAVQIACRELGIDTNRPLTVTGGLTFAGGPMNNYVMHSIARMAQLLRESPGKRGMITANGGYITKHAFGIYSSDAPEQSFQHANLQDQVDATLKRDVVIGYEGKGVVEGYSVMYGPRGVTKGFVAARLDDGRRAWGISEDTELLQSMTEEEFCGRQVSIFQHQATF